MPSAGSSGVLWRVDGVCKTHLFAKPQHRPHPREREILRLDSCTPHTIARLLLDEHRCPPSLRLVIEHDVYSWFAQKFVKRCADRRRGEYKVPRRGPKPKAPETYRSGTIENGREPAKPKEAQNHEQTGFPGFPGLPGLFQTCSGPRAWEAQNHE